MNQAHRSILAIHRSSRGMALLALAAAGVGISCRSARATYADQDTFNGSLLGNDFADPTQWSTGALPTAPELIVFPALLNTGFAGATFAAGNTITAYGIASTAPTVVIGAGGTLQLVSTDASSDGATTAPALQILPGGGANAIDLKNLVVLGNAASTSQQTATFDNSAGSFNNILSIESKVSEFAGSSWGLNITGDSPVQFKIGNYITNMFAYSGDTNIGSGADLRVFANVIPHGAGRGNLVINGQFDMDNQTNALVVNGLSGAGALNRIGSANGFVVGANNATAQFDGQIKNVGIALTKVGMGTQTLTNSSNLNTMPVTIDGGVLAVTSIANIGFASALGAGVPTGQGPNAASIVLDGGVLSYIGSTDVSTNRSFTLNGSGGGIDSSGTGAINFTDTLNYNQGNIITRPAEVNTGAAGTEAVFMPSTVNITAGMSVIGTNLQTGTTVTSVDSTTQITISKNRTAAIANSSGAETLTFTPQTMDRAFTFSGTNTGANTLAAPLFDPTSGKLSVVKTGAGRWNVNGASTYTGNTTVSAGTLTFGQSLTTSSSVNIASGAAMTLSVAGNHVVSTQGLNIAPGGTLDLGDNDLIVDYTGASPLATIKSWLASGFNNGNENGAGIISSATLTNGTSELGYAENSQVNVGTLDGVTPDQTAVIVKYTYFGDTNLDGSVNGSDFGRFLDGLATGGSTWFQGDFTYDSRVDLGNDFELFLVGYLGQGNSLGALAPIIEENALLSSTQKAQLLAVVPEPTMIGAGSLLAMAIMARRRRK